jgi:hypothetical integral membrane protein (TIGR02206 family)
MGSGFESFSVQHLTTLFALGTMTYVAISKGRNLDEPARTNLGLVIAGVTFSTLISEGILKLAAGTFDLYVDLPFFLCDLVAMVLPFVLYLQNRKWTGILYFWAMAGTMQALITPDLDQGFPSFDFFRYFIGHAGIVAAVLYTVIVKKIKIGWQDFLNAIIYAQVYLVGVHMVNQALGSNYSYTMGKPPGPSVLDLMGPWPWYLLWGEILMVILFLLLILPFVLKPGFRKGSEVTDDGMPESH